MGITLVWVWVVMIGMALVGDRGVGCDDKVVTKLYGDGLVMGGEKRTVGAACVWGR